MTDLILTTFDWVPEMPRGFVRDMRVRWALEEAGLPYRVEEHAVSRSAARAFRAQPFGQVPWLTDGDISPSSRAARSCCISARCSDKLMPADRRGRSEVKEWLFAALTSVEAASQPWSFFMFSADTGETPMRKLFDDFLIPASAQAHGNGPGSTRMAGRDLLRSRHSHGGRAAPRRSVRWAREISPLAAPTSRAPRPDRPSRRHTTTRWPTLLRQMQLDNAPQRASCCSPHWRSYALLPLASRAGCLTDREVKVESRQYLPRSQLNSRCFAFSR